MVRTVINHATAQLGGNDGQSKERQNILTHDGILLSWRDIDVTCCLTLACAVLLLL
jgi:hypothetical protein